jgi:hypothetical protein
MEELLKSLSGWWNGDYGTPPKVITDHLHTGSISRGLKWRITYRTRKVIEEHNTGSYKFGKSGQPKKRAKGDDYTNEEPYTKMFLVYESESHGSVSELETYYIKKHREQHGNDNVSTTDQHQMVSHNGKYYLYLVL